MRNACDGNLCVQRIRQFVVYYCRCTCATVNRHLFHFVGSRDEQKVEFVFVVRQFYLFAVFRQCQNEIIRIGIVNIAEHRISVLAGIARSPIQFRPHLSPVVRDIPITVFPDLQLRGDAVIAFVSVIAFEGFQPFFFGAPITIFDRQFIGRFAVVAITSVERCKPCFERAPVAFLDCQFVGRFAGHTLCHDPIPTVVRQPFTVERPIIDAAILFDPDHRRRTLLAVFSVVYRYRTAFDEGDRVADRFPVFYYRGYTGHVIVALQCFYDQLKGGYIGVHPAAQLFERGQTRIYILALVPYGDFVVLRTGNQRQ